MSCSHKETSFKKVTINYFGLDFSTKMEVCEKCDAFQWTKESRARLNWWLAEKKKSHRDHFVIQAAISDHAANCLTEISKDYPGLPMSTLIRAMTLVFLHYMEQPKYANLFDSVSENKVYQSFLDGEKSITKVQFGVSGMLNIHSWSKILHVKPSKVVEEAVYRLTAIQVDRSPELKKFWEQQILPQISLILKAAA